MNTAGVDYFNRGHWLTKIQVQYSLSARRRMFELWQDFALQNFGRLEGLSLLDLGATPDCERQDSNCMIPWFQEDKLKVTLSSPEDIKHLESVFPNVEVVSPETNIPDQTYDWVSSSAVLEHVGSLKAQKAFLKECGRMGKGLFLTTPNRWHWLEFHTKIPFIHWLPKKAHRGVLGFLKHSFWADEKNLNLTGQKELEKAAEEAIGSEFYFQIQTVRALGMTSNLVLLAIRKEYARNKR